MAAADMAGAAVDTLEAVDFPEAAFAVVARAYSGAALWVVSTAAWDAVIGMAAVGMAGRASI
jgi:hypothetical protein